MAVSSESGSEDVAQMSHVAGRSDETWGEWDHGYCFAQEFFRTTVVVINGNTVPFKNLANVPSLRGTQLVERSLEYMGIIHPIGEAEHGHVHYRRYTVQNWGRGVQWIHYNTCTRPVRAGTYV